jgi:chorismate--pyruvate lyase
MKSHFSITGEPNWRFGSVIRRHLPAALRDWLLDESSLTQRLQAACTGRFHVEIVSLGWRRPLHDEAQALGVAPWQRALIREVQLWCNDQPWVFARTVIPVRTLRGAQRRLAHLGPRPLGDFLFSHPTLKRSPIQVARIAATSQLLAGCDISQDAVWGRRSVFNLKGHPLLVSEFFLPALPPFHQRNTNE